MKIKNIFKSEKGEVYVSNAVKIVICVVLGAAILAGLVLIANGVILPKTKAYFSAMFDKGEDIRGEMWIQSSSEEEKEEMSKVKDSIAIAIIGYMASQTSQYEEAITLLQSTGVDAGTMAEFYLGVVVTGKNTLYGTSVTKEEMDAVAENALIDNPNDKSALAYIQIRDAAGGITSDATTMNNINEFQKDYVNYSFDIERGKLTEEEAMNKIMDSAEKHGIPLEMFG